jgi:serine/threonine protein kinase
MLPIRLTTEMAARVMDRRGFSNWTRTLRRTFTTHEPPIQIGDYIGSGGFAQVFKATSYYEGVTDFAIKVLIPGLLQARMGAEVDPPREEMRIKDIKKRFTNESYVQWDLSQSLSERISQSVVRVYDHGEFDSRHRFRFILMERMGSTLRGFMNRKDTDTEDARMLAYKSLLMARIANIIFNVHMEGIIHRDIKPENIFFARHDAGTAPIPSVLARRKYERDIHVKLGDFGTVRWVRSYSSKYDGVIIGSQWYLSPEQIFNPEHLDTRTDIYSFGVVCYELLYGIHPKNVNPDTRNILEKLARTPPVSRTPPAGYEGLNDIILKCMADLPGRYQSMGDVVREMRDFVRTTQK